MADLLDLFKVGAVLFSKDPLRTWQRVDEMRANKQNQSAVDSLFGPMQSNGITWNTPRPVEGASPQMAELLKNPIIGQLMQAPQFREQMAQQVMASTLPKTPQLQEVAPGASLVPIDTRTGLPQTTGIFTAPAAPREAKLSDLAQLKADLDAGRIDEPTYRAAVAKANYIAPRDTPETWKQLSTEEAAAKGLPKGGTYEVSSRGQTRAVVNPTKEMGPAAMKLANAEVGANSILYALDKFEKEINDAPDGAQMQAFLGGLTPAGQKLNTAWTNAALLAKGEDLFNLGVLSGPDLDIIQKSLPDPTTKGGALKDKETYKAGINTIRDLVKFKLGQVQRTYGGGNEPAQAPAAPPQGVTQEEWAAMTPEDRALFK